MMWRPCVAPVQSGPGRSSGLSWDDREESRLLPAGAVPFTKVEAEQLGDDVHKGASCLSG